MDKIKEHQSRVQERKQRPRGNPREEMEAAKKDLEMVSLLFESWRLKFSGFLCKMIPLFQIELFLRASQMFCGTTH